MSRLRVIGIAAALGVAIGAAGAVGFALLQPGAPEGLRQQMGIADIGGPFTLTDEDGKTVTEADLLGKPTVVYFGFTYCPDVCPTTLYELTGLIERLGTEADKLNFVFVSVDWERDKPADLKRYTSAFDARIRGLSGTEEQIEQVAKAYKIYYRRVPTDDGYTIDHTASVFLMDKDGKFVGTLAYGEDADTMLKKLENLADKA
ncbi:SCO family protein [Afifella sp. IM 167]|uniref:SCO family protein n=1 Tax=Afifella sp. IM 167 TaxID=2033586 RepID=UPI001CCF33F8